MGDIITALQNTPVPTILVVGGLIFLFLAIVGQFVGEIKVPKERQIWAGLIGFLLLFSGVALYVAPVSLLVPTPTIVAAVAPNTLTSTPAPTRTPMPTGCAAQPQAEATIEAVQETTASLVPGAKVIWYDSFDCSNLSYGWNISRGGLGTMIKASNGTVRISAQRADNTWDGIYRATRNIQDGRGALVLFRYEAGAVVSLFIDTGEWQTPNYRSWGLGINESNADPYETSWEGRDGIHYVGERILTALRPREWNYLLIKLGNNGELITRVWERNDPNRQAELRTVRNADWVELQWQFFIQAHEGALEIDEYQEIEFANP